MREYVRESRVESGRNAQARAVRGIYRRNNLGQRRLEVSGVLRVKRGGLSHEPTHGFGKLDDLNV
ncbi:hypothetical protein EMIHUDRAFT_234879 [Emiliania huxleyi CCMP1516]|uniref:Uncharacterized protein n=2 Tax=Emiliania huxleyi TaxID=2903 RepID=A0A0D3JXN8_EMIH1|nr:hypothetical protein EMIHUDRAFT_234879 [Emiliania huxleyi CCMP1516]EOD28273.1 hypothetical protein EMIHUDRAFT_234879 [Emiliania huxleyi CCMP1516]|eukprot:XP_005780702.1 hypothetical protein EMIHUDRAFT_234879 [Emiliania huxleyi CCMP1516]